MVLHALYRGRHATTTPSVKIVQIWRAVAASIAAVTLLWKVGPDEHSKLLQLSEKPLAQGRTGRPRLADTPAGAPSAAGWVHGNHGFSAARLIPAEQCDECRSIFARLE